MARRRRGADRLIALAALLIGATLTALTSAPAQAASGGTTLTQGQELTAGQYLQNGNFKLIMQTDGNFVLYACGTAIWASGTANSPGNFIAMQYDGNLVIYNPSHVALWASNTAGNPGAHLALQVQDQVTIYSTSGSPLWYTNTVTAPNCSDIVPGNTNFGANVINSANGEYHFSFNPSLSSDLQVYNNSGQVLWSVSCQPAQEIRLSQGRMYVSYFSGAQLYNSCAFGTGTAGGFYLQEQNDGNLVLYTDYRTALWSAFTG